MQRSEAYEPPGSLSPRFRNCRNHTKPAFAGEFFVFDRCGGCDILSVFAYVLDILRLISAAVNDEILKAEMLAEGCFDDLFPDRVRPGNVRMEREAFR